VGSLLKESNLDTGNQQKKISDNAELVGYYAAHEQHSLSQLLDFVVRAEKGGFTTTMTSDHFHPWWHNEAFGNFTWVWLTAAAERTKKMKFVTGVTAPIYRYHPAIIAQAFASLDVLYPGRIALGLGTGEAMNEVPLGFDWTSTSSRRKRMLEAKEIIEKLWYADRKPFKQGRNGFVYFNGEYFLIRQARLYTPPKTHIPIYIAGSGERSTRAAAKYSDGLITFVKSKDSMKMFKIFNAEAKRNGKDPTLLQKIAAYKVSYSKDYEQAFKSSNFWRATLLKNAFVTQISDPRKLQLKALKEVPDERLKESVHIVTVIEDCIKSIEDYFKAGFTRVYVHSTSPDELEFIRVFSNKVLPYFSK
jgi:coenzyme F420-dependent glucose-6-phosphate dehydrogenase